MTALTRRYRFSASHRLHSAELSDLENERLYGKCNNPYGHGHDYVLQVTAVGDVDPVTGLVLPVSQLDKLVIERVLRPFDHRYINIDVPAFQTLVPTTENVVLYIGGLLREYWLSYVLNPAVRLRGVQLHETDRNSFEVVLGANGRGARPYAQQETVLAGK